MTPRIGRICAYIQVAMAAGTLPASILALLGGIPFGWEIAGIAWISTLGVGAGISALGIPIFGIVISWAWPQQKEIEP